MNENNNYRRGLIKGGLALIGGFFFFQLARFGLRAAPEMVPRNQGAQRTETGVARHGYEGVSVAMKQTMLGRGQKLG